MIAPFAEQQIKRQAGGSSAIIDARAPDKILRYPRYCSQSPLARRRRPRHWNFGGCIAFQMW
jgi:hypothetical protein